MKKTDLPDLVIEALRHLGGQDEIVPIARYIWERYEAQLKASGDLYYTWQYDIRWAAQKLQDSGTLLKTRRGARSIWKLT